MLTTAQITSLYAASRIQPSELRATRLGLQLILLLVGLAMTAITLFVCWLSTSDAISWPPAVQWASWAVLVASWVGYLVWRSQLTALDQAMKLFLANPPLIQEYRAFLATAEALDIGWVQKTMT